MKCVCGYERRDVYHDGVKVSQIGKEEFVEFEIPVNFTKVLSNKPTTLTCYICPKCGTIKTEDR